jgi:hypothetical protein
MANPDGFIKKVLAHMYKKPGIAPKNECVSFNASKKYTNSPPERGITHPSSQYANDPKWYYVLE